MEIYICSFHIFVVMPYHIYWKYNPMMSALIYLHVCGCACVWKHIQTRGGLWVDEVGVIKLRFSAPFPFPSPFVTPTLRGGSLFLVLVTQPVTWWRFMGWRWDCLMAWNSDSPTTRCKGAVLLWSHSCRMVFQILRSGAREYGRYQFSNRCKVALGRGAHAAYTAVCRMEWQLTKSLLKETPVTHPVAAT